MKGLNNFDLILDQLNKKIDFTIDSLTKNSEVLFFYFNWFFSIEEAHL